MHWMERVARTWFFLLLALAGASCEAGTDPAALAATGASAQDGKGRETPAGHASKGPGQFAGRRYSGTVTASGEGSGAGSAEASFTRTGTGVTFRLRGDAGNSRFALEVPGRLGPGGAWQGSDDTTSLSIDGQGRMTGSGSDGRTRLQLDGRLEPSALRLEIDIAQVGAPANPTVTTLRFDLSPDQTPAVRADPPESQSPEGRCKRVEWRLKTVANLSGGPMQTVRVPECIK